MRRINRMHKPSMEFPTKSFGFGWSADTCWPHWTSKNMDGGWLSHTVTIKNWRPIFEVKRTDGNPISRQDSLLHRRWGFFGRLCSWGFGRRHRLCRMLPLSFALVQHLGIIIKPYISVIGMYVVCILYNYMIYIYIICMCMQGLHLGYLSNPDLANHHTTSHNLYQLIIRPSHWPVVVALGCIIPTHGPSSRQWCGGLFARCFLSCRRRLRCCLRHFGRGSRGLGGTFATHRSARGGVPRISDLRSFYKRNINHKRS